ncbi:MAG: cell division protein ZapB [Candidatus Zixiibacteriota bacterium]
MNDKLDLLAEKIEKVVQRLEAMTVENRSLKQQNKSLTGELNQLRKDFDVLKLSAADQSENARTKLTSILHRLDQLESVSE